MTSSTTSCVSELAFHDRASVGQLMTRVTDDTEQVRQFAATGVAELVNIAVLLIGTAVLLFSIDPVLAPVALVVVPVVGVLGVLGARMLRPRFFALQEARGGLSAQLQEALAGVRVVQAFSAESRTVDRYAADNEVVYDRRLGLARIFTSIFPAMEALLGLTTAAVLLLGGQRVASGATSVGTLVAFASYIVLLGQPVRRLGFLLNLAARASASASRVFDLIDREPAMAASASARLPSSPEGALAWQGVDFAFGSTPVLTDVDLTVEPGEHVAVVGRSGSGKSALVSLLTRLYDPVAGRVTIDGVDIADVTLDEVRSTVASVEQEAFLFSASVAENIAFARPDATRTEIVEAARLAGAAPFIDALPDGYDTLVGERGVTLSGGQRQRIALARALLVGAPVLVLDDAVLRGRRAHRARDPRRARRRRADPHRRQRRPAAVDDPRGRPHRDGRRRKGGRDRHARGAARRRRSVRRAVPLDRRGAHRRGCARSSHVAVGSPSDRRRERVVSKGAARARAESDLTRPEGAGLSVIARVVGLTRPHARSLVLAGVLMLVATATSLAGPQLVEYAIDEGMRGGSASALRLAVAGYALATVAGAGAGAWQRYALIRVGVRVITDLRNRLFGHLLRLGQGFHDRNRPGDLMSRMTSDAETLSDFITWSVITTVQSALTLVGIVVILFTKDVGLTLASFVVVPLMAAATWRWTTMTRRRYAVVRAAVGDVSARAEESLSGIRVVKGLGQERAQQARFEVANQTQRREDLGTDRVSAGFYPVIDVLSDVAVAVVPRSWWPAGPAGLPRSRSAGRDHPLRPAVLRAGARADHAPRQRAGRRGRRAPHPRGARHRARDQRRP